MPGVRSRSEGGPRCVHDRSPGDCAPREVLEQYRGEPEIDAFLERLERQTETPGVEAWAGMRMEMIEAQRSALLAARSEGTFSSAALTSALDNLDADQISLEMRRNS
jgi:monovalent cation/hydrogen antiporter